MTEKSHLSGDLHPLEGHAPLSAMTPVDGPINRPQDMWFEGNPRELVRPTAEWREKLQRRVSSEPESLGLRIRFAMHALDPQIDLLRLVRSVLEALPINVDGLFLYAEFMKGPEEGLYLAWENRPPALGTQVWSGSGAQDPSETLRPVAGPVHLNVLLHDPEISYQDIWRDGTLDDILARLRGLCTGTCSARDNIHQFSLARSDSHKSGFSLGVESAGREEGSHGGSVS